MANEHETKIDSAFDDIRAAFRDQDAKITELEAEVAQLEHETGRLRDDHERLEKRLAEVLLRVADNCGRAIDAIPKETDDNREILKGIRLIREDAEAELSTLGYERVEAVGQPFDPRLHGTGFPVETNEPGENIVVGEILRGYRSRASGMWLRPGEVTVAKASQGLQPGITVGIAPTSATRSPGREGRGSSSKPGRARRKRMRRSNSRRGGTANLRKSGNRKIANGKRKPGRSERSNGKRR